VLKAFVTCKPFLNFLIFVGLYFILGQSDWKTLEKVWKYLPQTNALAYCCKVKKVLSNLSEEGEKEEEEEDENL
jgi:hypothetical protein